MSGRPAQPARVESGPMLGGRAWIAGAESVSSLLQQVRLDRALPRAHRAQRAQTVFDRHGAIIEGVNNEDGRSGGVHMLLGRPTRDGGGAWGLAKQVQARD